MKMGIAPEQLGGIGWKRGIAGSSQQTQEQCLLHEGRASCGCFSTLVFIVIKSKKYPSRLFDTLRRLFDMLRQAVEDAQVW